MRHLKRNVVLLDTDDELWLEYFDVRILVTARHIPKGGYDVPEIVVNPSRGIVAYCPDDSILHTAGDPQFLTPNRP